MELVCISMNNSITATYKHFVFLTLYFAFTTNRASILFLQCYVRVTPKGESRMRNFIFNCFLNAFSQYVCYLIKNKISHIRKFGHILKTLFWEFGENILSGFRARKNRPDLGHFSPLPPETEIHAHPPNSIISKFNL